MYSVIDNKIVDENGWVALRLRQATQKVLRANGREYTFVVRSDISVAWVHPDDVDKILNMKVTCCGGHQSLFVMLCDELHIKRWLGVSVW